ncbi:MAG: Calx-beta domain-containing protein [Planctomycetota bacterium]|jgi:hypothetical protein
MCNRSFILTCIVLILCSADFGSAGDVILQCDAGEGALQAGWTQVVAGLNSNVAGTGIDVTLATGNFAAIAARDTGGAGALANVETDLYFANDQTSSPNSDFILTLSNLTPGVGYRLLSYHNRSDEAATVIPGVTVTGATVLSKPPYIVQDHNIMDYPAQFQFVAGAGPVEIRYQGPDGGCAGCQAFFNGFQLQYGSPTITFATDSSGGVETISPALIPVHLSNAEPGQAYAVRYKVIGGTATGGGVDYTLPTGILSFGPEETIKYISIDIVSDGIQEADETIILELFGPLGPGVVLGLSQHTYTISDRPPDVSFAGAAGSRPENATPALVQVTLSHASDQTVTVDYSVTGGTALGGGVDYTLLPGTLVFDPCQTADNISISVVDDADIEEDETIVLALSNPTNATLGAQSTHTHTIVDDESGVYWNGLIWFYSELTGGPYVNDQGQLEWAPEKGGQYVTRMPTQDFSAVGQKVEVIYWYLSDGKDDCPPDSCYNCIYCDDDITCIAGTSDFRIGLFQADGEYVDQDGWQTSNSIFEGYKGYNFRFGPHLQAYPTRWVDCTGEVHKTGMFCKKPQSSSNLMTRNEGEMDYIPGFELPPGEWSLFTVSLERTSSSSVRLSITLNGRTYTDTDSAGSEQPTQIDVFGVHMRNGRPYTRLVFDNLCALGPADFDGDDVVNEEDLAVIGRDWLMMGEYVPAGTEPDANALIVYYKFNETSGSTANDSSGKDNHGQVQKVSDNSPVSTAWDPAGYDGSGCINFDGDTKVVVPPAAFGTVTSHITVSLWVNGDPVVQPDQAWGMAFHGKQTSPVNDRLIYAHIPTKYGNVMLESGSYNAQRIEWAGAAPSTWEGEWNPPLGKASGTTTSLLWIRQSKAE